jgi:hypothetical protein
MEEELFAPLLFLGLLKMGAFSFKNESKILHHDIVSTEASM